MVVLLGFNTGGGGGGGGGGFGVVHGCFGRGKGTGNERGLCI